MGEEAAGRAVSGEMGIHSPQGWVTKGPGKGFAIWVQQTLCPGGQTPTPWRDKQVI